VNWERMVLGHPGRNLGRWRWPLLGIGGAVLGVLWASIGAWTEAGIAAAVAVVAAALTARKFL
jgi:hypothetical protein